MAIQVIKFHGATFEVNTESKREKQDRVWLARYQQMLEFIETYGHQRFPYEKTSKIYTPENYRLMQWATHQRLLFRRDNLPKWKENLLNKANFIWEPYEFYWNSSFNKLVEFKEKYGHLNVPRMEKAFHELGEWIAKQRLRKNKLSEEYIKRLDDLGFEWGVKRTQWEVKFEELKSYFKKNNVTQIRSVDRRTEAVKPIFRWSLSNSNIIAKVD